MKVVVFSELMYPEGSGAEVATWLYCKNLADLGVAVTVITSSSCTKKVESLNKKLSIIRIPTKFKYVSRYDTILQSIHLFNRSIKKVIDESDVVYVPACWFAAIPFAHWCNKPVLLHVHNYHMASPTSILYDPLSGTAQPSKGRSFFVHELMTRRSTISAMVSTLLNELFGKHYLRLSMLADGYVFVSKTQMNDVCILAPNIKRRSHVIYNPLPDLSIVESRELGVGYLGGRDYIKGYPTLLNALKIHGGADIESVYMTGVSSKRKTLQLANSKLHFLPRIPRENLERIYSRITIVVVPSLCPEPLPYVVIEAILRGKLVVGSNIGGIAELASYFDEGFFLSRPGDPKDLRDQISRALSIGTQEATDIGLKNRSILKGLVNNTKVAHQLMTIMQDLVTTYDRN